MVLLGYKAQVVACFGPFGDSANLNARLVHGLRQTHHRLKNHFGRIRWYSYVTWVKWRLVSVRLVIVLTSTERRRMVYAKCAIGSEISLDAPDGTPRSRG